MDLAVDTDNSRGFRFGGKKFPSAASDQENGRWRWCRELNYLGMGEWANGRRPGWLPCLPQCNLGKDPRDSRM